tara:strand:- start:1872 stop:2972 length:1101 start_codon:yes stop_codon:yes gene_type:complete
MATRNFKSIGADDITTTRTLLHEAIPLTGAIYTYSGSVYADSNVKNYAHGMFQSVYDYPYLSSSSNHIFDLTACYTAQSGLSASANTQNSKKINQYTLLAQSLLGYTGSLTDPARQVRQFESDLNFDTVNEMQEVMFLNFARLLTKDEIKKGSFTITLGTGSWGSPFGVAGGKTVTLTDKSASADGTGIVNTSGGDMGLLYSATNNKVSGAIFYQAGIVVLSGSVWRASSSAGRCTAATTLADFYKPSSTSTLTFDAALTGAAISQSCNALRHRIQNISFNNTTEINSKIYFCRVPHNEFNYSSNPTYLSGSKIRVKQNATDNPVAYITTVGLYSTTGELLAVAKLSEPIRKDPTNDITLRVRLDF